MAGSPLLLPDAMSVLDSSSAAPHCNNGYCRNPIAASGGQKCRDCLDEDAARKRNISVETLREERARAAAKAKALQANHLARPPPKEGFHFCYTCNKEVADAEFDLDQSTSRCKQHYEKAKAAQQVRAAKKKAQSLSSDATVPAVAEHDAVPIVAEHAAVPVVVAHGGEAQGKEIHFTFDSQQAALDFVEVCGHQEHVMYRLSKSDVYGNATFLCHCGDKLRPAPKGMGHRIDFLFITH